MAFLIINAYYWMIATFVAMAIKMAIQMVIPNTNDRTFSMTLRAQGNSITKFYNFWRGAVQTIGLINIYIFIVDLFGNQIIEAITQSGSIAFYCRHGILLFFGIEMLFDQMHSPTLFSLIRWISVFIGEIIVLLIISGLALSSTFITAYLFIPWILTEIILFIVKKIKEKKNRTNYFNKLLWNFSDVYDRIFGVWINLAPFIFLGIEIPLSFFGKTIFQYFVSIYS